MSLKDRVKAARKHARLTQKALAKKIGGEITQTTISDLETGKQKSATFLAKMAHICGVNALWLETGTGEQFEENKTMKIGTFPIVTWSEKDDLSDDYVFIERYNLKFEGGNGNLQWEIDQKRPLAFTKEFLKSRGIKKPEHAKCVYVCDQSMRPYLSDGDIILIDTKDILPLKDGECYAIRYGDRYRVKRIKMNFDGSITLRSDNPDKTTYPDEPVPFDLLDQICVIGMVKWRAG